MRITGLGMRLVAAAAASSLVLTACGESAGGGSGDSVTLNLGYAVSDSHPFAASGILPFVEEVGQVSGRGVSWLMRDLLVAVRR